jgi:hypothetical protein
VWVLDEVKHRAAHFTLQGRYLGAVGGLPNDARDLPQAISMVEDPSALDYSTHEGTLHISMKAGWDRRFEFSGEQRLWVSVAQVQLSHQHTYLWLIVSEPYRRHGHSGDFLLELDGQGSVVRLERVAITRDYATVYRPFYVASDGSVYQLFASNTRAELRVRP